MLGIRGETRRSSLMLFEVEFHYLDIRIAATFSVFAGKVAEEETISLNVLQKNFQTVAWFGLFHSIGVPQTSTEA